MQVEDCNLKTHNLQTASLLQQRNDNPIEIKPWSKLSALSTQHSATQHSALLQAAARPGGNDQGLKPQSTCTGN